MDICRVEGCCKTVKAKGLCAMHHQRMRRHGDIHYSRPPKASCMRSGCEEPSVARGYCRKHYYFLVRTGQMQVGAMS
ncbi:hypothetical protein DNH61_22885 [Paenibacillus sambharensis]|uniref:Uncharacterized protein n=1 Tax=Paenibacillus sambharensis TaxID=1803190 RepID=A0A2W1L337_9BACL|nr:hypothetical protein [Paenibacillus sambharensis]PZD93473.1 hypothetical protein DNH61_22885 [Paenibacillus sambharensis]